MFPTDLETAIRHAGPAADLASNCGVTRGHLSRVRNGDRSLSPALEGRIVAALRAQAEAFARRAQAIAETLDGRQADT